MTHNPSTDLRFRTHVHHPDHHVLLAFSRDGYRIGAARFIRHEDDRHAADVEVSVDDAWRGSSAGSELLQRVMDQARSQGVRRIVVALPAEPALTLTA